MLDILPVMIIQDSRQINIYTACRYAIDDSLFPPAEETDRVPFRHWHLASANNRMQRFTCRSLGERNIIVLQPFIDIDLSQRRKHGEALNKHPFTHLHKLLACRCIDPRKSIRNSIGLGNVSFGEKDAQLTRLMAAGKMILHLEQYRRRYLIRNFTKCQHDILRVFG
ncbi:hypothetical protein D3C75_831490 [compost metagenome]